MATTSSAAAYERPLSSSIRSSIRPTQTSGPHTPQRHRQGLPSFASSSPGSLRNEEDVVIVEIGTRWLRAGFEGDSAPVCVVGFGPEESRRVGDYRGWIRNTQGNPMGFTSFQDVEQWSKGHELWSMDIRGLDIGLVEDRIERAFRDLYNKYLLTDAGSSRLALILPSVVPYPLLSALLSTLFHRWRYPSITLLPSAAMAAVSAGVRSALVVDIGWEETTVTTIYEYREAKTRRSTRAMKYLMQRMGLFLSELIRDSDNSAGSQPEGGISIPFDHCEEVLGRTAWCRQRQGSNPDQADDPGRRDAHSDRTISLPLPTPSGLIDAEVPFSRISDVVEEALFAGGTDSRDWDDGDMPLDVLVYNTLLAVSPDVRGVCMSRITFIGGGSEIPGIRRRILTDVEALIKRFEWRVTRGAVIDKLARAEGQHKGHRAEDTSSQQSGTSNGSLPEPESNFIDEKLKRQDKESKLYVRGILRETESLGPWAGASLVASLKIRGMVEVEREKFLQHGLAGASRDSEHPTIERRSMYGPTMARSGGERSSWTLGEWA